MLIEQNLVASYSTKSESWIWSWVKSIFHMRYPVVKQQKLPKRRFLVLLVWRHLNCFVLQLKHFFDHRNSVHLERCDPISRISKFRRHVRIYRGYCTVARRYEFYVRVARTVSHEWVQRTSEILFLSLEHKIQIFEPSCNVLFIIWRLNKRDARNQFNKSKRRESWRHWTIRHSQRWHTENTPLGSRIKWRMESTSGLVPSKTLSSI